MGVFVCEEKERVRKKERETQREENPNIKHFWYSIRRRQVWECSCVKREKEREREREREIRKCTITLAQVCTLNFQEKKREKKWAI